MCTVSQYKPVELCINYANGAWQDLCGLTCVSGIPKNLFRGVQQIQLRTEDRQNWDLGAAAPYSGVLEAAVIWYKKFHFI